MCISHTFFCISRQKRPYQGLDVILKMKGGEKMKKLLNVVAEWLYAYGKANAGMASIRGSYEAPVPKKLQ